MRAVRAALVAVTLLPFGSAVSAQVPAHDAASRMRAGIAENAAPPLRGDPARMRAGSNTYDVVVTGDSSTMAVGTHRVEVHEASFAGRPAWMVVEHREALEPFVRITAIDTVLLSRDALAPMRWEARTGDARFAAAFTADSVYGGATSPMGRRTFTLGSRGALLTSEGALDALLRSATLHPGWSAEATMLVADLGGGRLVPATLELAYESSLAIPAGTFDVWVVHAASGGTDRWIWIDKRTGVVVRTETLSPHMPGMIVERILSHPPQP